MQLSNERSKLEVEMLGYEVSNSKDKDTLSLVRMTACIDDLSWSAVEPCLRAFELVELLVDWFESFATDRPTVGTISFTEHELGLA